MRDQGSAVADFVSLSGYQNFHHGLSGGVPGGFCITRLSLPRLVWSPTLAQEIAQIVGDRLHLVILIVPQFADQIVA